MESIPHPPIVSRSEWLAARKALLAKEKALTKQHDALAAELRRLPMVRIDKTYRFDGENGEASLRDLFGDHHQLIVYHFMFAPEWEKGCSGCTSFVDALGDLSMLAERDTSFVLVSRAPIEKLLAYRTERGWKRPWFSSNQSTFNQDFHVTFDSSITPIEYNYKSKEEIAAKGHEPKEGAELPGLSVFFRVGEELFHTYSTYARGVEALTDAYPLLDKTPYGRQEDFENSPTGWPQRPTYGK